MAQQAHPGFELAAPLRADCHVLGRLPLCHVLLMNKAEVPWFILVPATSHIEVCDLSADQQLLLHGEVNQLSRFVRGHFDTRKLNVAAIGNLVAQLHIHVVGRHPDDPWWPNVVWGQISARSYAAARVAEIAQCLVTALGADYRPA